MLISFFLLCLWITAENRTKLKKFFIWTINQTKRNTTNIQIAPGYSSATTIMVVVFWTERDFCIIFITGVHSTTNFKTYEQAKTFFNSENTHSLSKEFLKEKRHTFIGIATFSFSSICKYWIYVMDDIKAYSQPS